MNEEEKKAIGVLKALNNLEKKCKIEKVPYNSEIKKIRISLLPEDYGIFEILLNLIVKLQKENIEQKAEIERRKHNNKTLKEFVSAVFNEELNDKYIIHLTDKQYNAAIANAQNDINQKWIQKVKEINKGINSLKQSRKKWKYRYYKMKNKNKDLQKSVEQIYDDYQDIGKMAFDYSDKLELKDKIIDLMSEWLYEDDTSFGYVNLKEINTKEKIKQYFENKAKELLNK